jgi:hypothetical protein
LAYIRVPDVIESIRSLIKGQFEFGDYARTFWAVHATLSKRDALLESAILETFKDANARYIFSRLYDDWGISLVQFVIESGLATIFMSPLSEISPEAKTMYAPLRSFELK